MAIDLAYLHGVSDAPSAGATIRYINPLFSYPEERELMSGFEGLLGADTLKRTRRGKRKIEMLSDQRVLENISGMMLPNDIEALRNYLAQTKQAVDENPALIQGMRNPATFSSMLNYLLSHWDSANRELAAQQMAKREKMMASRNLIKYQDSDDPLKGLFFSAVYHAIKPQSKIAQEVGVSGILDNLKQNLRKGIAKKRKSASANSAVQSLIANAKSKNGTLINKIKEARARRKGKGKKNAATPTSTANGAMAVNSLVSSATPVAGLFGLENEDPMDEATIAGVLYGIEETEYINEVINDTEEADRRYLTRLNGAMAEAPALFFDTAEEADIALEGLGTILANWDGNRDAAVAYAEKLTENSTSLNGKLKKFFKKVGKKIKSAVKKVGQAVKKVAQKIKKVVKKIGKAIAKVAKKVWKFIVKFNPITAIMRAIMLLMARCNWFSMASKCYPGSFPKEESMAKFNITAEYYDKCKKGYDKYKKVFVNIGGSESKLKNRLEKGYKRKAKGDLNTGINFSKIKSLYKEGDKEAKEEEKEEEKAVEAKGTPVYDEQMKEPGMMVGKQQVEEIANGVVTTAAASLYEKADDKSKVLASVPKGIGLLYDITTNNTTYYCVNFGGHNGFVKKSLCRVATSDEAKTFKNTDTTKTVEVEEPVNGLGFPEPVTISAISGSVSTIAALVGSLAKVFGKDKVANVANAVSTAANTTGNLVNQGAQIVSDGKDALLNMKDQGAEILTNLKNTGETFAQTANSLTTNISNVKNSIETAKEAYENVKGSVQTAIDQGKETVSQIKATVSNVKDSVNNVIDQGKNIVSTVKQSVNDVKAIANGETPASAKNTTTDNTAPATNADSGVSASMSSKTKMIIAGVLGAVGLGGIIYFATRRK